MEQFEFEKLDIYQHAVDFALEIRKVCNNIKTDDGILEQLKRSALSISLNIAEGSERFHNSEKKHFYYIARGSLFECNLILTILYKEQNLTEDQLNSIYTHIISLAAMLTKLIKSVE